MDAALGLLTFGTIGFVAIFAYVSARATEKQLEETRRRKASDRAVTGAQS
jgi:hypothetical protein